MTHTKEDGEIKKRRAHLSIRRVPSGNNAPSSVGLSSHDDSGSGIESDDQDSQGALKASNNTANGHYDGGSVGVEKATTSSDRGKGRRHIRIADSFSSDYGVPIADQSSNRNDIAFDIDKQNDMHKQSMHCDEIGDQRLDDDTKAHENENDQRSQQGVILHLQEIRNKTHEELVELADSLHLENPDNLHKNDLVYHILQKIAERGGTLIGDGTLDVLQDGYGFLRSSRASYMSAPDDIYVSHNQIRKNGLRTGDTIIGLVRGPKRGERYFALNSIQTVNGLELSKNRHRPHFDDLTPMFPDSRIKLETKSTNLSSRILDIAAPLGRGQRALIVAPPRTGKTMLMQNIAHSITDNYPDISLIVLLIDERPEEVTDMSRSVKGDVVSSTCDEPSHRHVQLAEMVIEKAKRLVEAKKDVVILLDSITRLARAYNNVAPSSGRVLSGGVDSNALQRPKRFFGAARNIEEGGSLTIIATALIETGSRMDEVIFEEFKGTGNLEIVLDRKISERRIFPAIDIGKSGTRKEDLLIDKATLAKIWILRRILNPMSNIDGLEFLMDKLKFSKSNDDFFDQMDTGPTKKNNI